MTTDEFKYGKKPFDEKLSVIANKKKLNNKKTTLKLNRIATVMYSKPTINVKIEYSFNASVFHVKYGFKLKIAPKP